MTGDGRVVDAATRGASSSSRRSTARPAAGARAGRARRHQRRSAGRSWPCTAPSSSAWRSRSAQRAGGAVVEIASVGEHQTLAGYQPGHGPTPAMTAELLFADPAGRGADARGGTRGVRLPRRPRAPNPRRPTSTLVLRVAVAAPVAERRVEAVERADPRRAGRDAAAGGRRRRLLVRQHPVGRPRRAGVLHRPGLPDAGGLLPLPPAGRGPLGRSPAARSCPTSGTSRGSHVSRRAQCHREPRTGSRPRERPPGRAGPPGTAAPRPPQPEARQVAQQHVFPPPVECDGQFGNVFAEEKPVPVAHLMPARAADGEGVVDVHGLRVEAPRAVPDEMGRASARHAERAAPPTHVNQRRRHFHRDTSARSAAPCRHTVREVHEAGIQLSRRALPPLHLPAAFAPAGLQPRLDRPLLVVPGARVATAIWSSGNLGVRSMYKAVGFLVGVGELRVAEAGEERKRPHRPHQRLVLPRELRRVAGAAVAPSRRAR